MRATPVAEPVCRPERPDGRSRGRGLEAVPRPWRAPAARSQARRAHPGYGRPPADPPGWPPRLLLGLHGFQRFVPACAEVRLRQRHRRPSPAPHQQCQRPVFQRRVVRPSTRPAGDRSGSRPSSAPGATAAAAAAKPAVVVCRAPAVRAADPLAIPASACGRQQRGAVQRCAMRPRRSVPPAPAPVGGSCPREPRTVASAS